MNDALEEKLATTLKSLNERIVVVDNLKREMSTMRSTNDQIST